MVLDFQYSSNIHYDMSMSIFLFIAICMRFFDGASQLLFAIILKKPLNFLFF